MSIVHQFFILLILCGSVFGHRNGDYGIHGHPNEEKEDFIQSTEDTPQLPCVQSSLRNDGFGSKLQQMVGAYAACELSKRCQFIGAAGQWSELASRYASRDYQSKRNKFLSLISLLQMPFGLQEEWLPQCEKAASFLRHNRIYGSSRIPSDFARDYSARIQSALSKESVLRHGAHHHHIVVHVRREDVKPKSGYTQRRYLPNEYYLKAIDSAVENFRNNFRMAVSSDTNGSFEYSVTVLGQTPSYEPYKVFAQKGYDVLLDVDEEEAWKLMLMADGLVISRSLFSYLPALFSRATHGDLTAPVNTPGTPSLPLRHTTTVATSQSLSGGLAGVSGTCERNVGDTIIETGSGAGHDSGLPVLLPCGSDTVDHKSSQSSHIVISPIMHMVRQADMPGTWHFIEWAVLGKS